MLLRKAIALLLAQAFLLPIAFGQQQTPEATRPRRTQPVWTSPSATTPIIDEIPPLRIATGPEPKIRVALNTDDRLMSDTEMSKELALATETFGLHLVDLEKMTLSAMKSAFAPHELRVDLIRKRILPGYSALLAELAERAFQGADLRYLS